MSDGTKRSETESIENELRALRVRGPRPALRERVILAAGQEAPPRERFGSWGVEMVLAAAILLVIAFTGVVNSRSSRSLAPAVVAADVDPTTRETCRLLGRAPQDWECRRLAIAARAPASDVARRLRSWIGTETLEGGMP